MEKKSKKSISIDKMGMIVVDTKGNSITSMVLYSDMPKGDFFYKEFVNDLKK